LFTARLDAFLDFIILLFLDHAHICVDPAGIHVIGDKAFVEVIGFYFFN
jgi:hypothetical protein